MNFIRLFQNFTRNECSFRVNVVTIVNRKVSVVKPSPSSRRRPRLLRKSCLSSSAPPAKLRGWWNLQSYLSTTLLLKLAVVFDYYVAMETYSRIFLLSCLSSVASTSSSVTTPRRRPRPTCTVRSDKRFEKMCVMIIFLFWKNVVCLRFLCMKLTVVFH